MLEKIGECLYRLELGPRFAGVHPVFHVSLLKLHHARGSAVAPPDPIFRDGKEEYEVEKIVGHRQRRN